ncbi:MAG: hypothetical protein CNLJKLNK_01140 [Holosporales bacterium]
MTIKIRLSDHDVNSITESFKINFLKEDHLWLFGSRTNLLKKGGDIDLYIETCAVSIKESLNMKARFITHVEKSIGEQKIDIILNLLHFPYDLQIYTIAKTEGIKLV